MDARQTRNVIEELHRCVHKKDPEFLNKAKMKCYDEVLEALHDDYYDEVLEHFIKLVHDDYYDEVLEHFIKLEDELVCLTYY